MKYQRLEEMLVSEKKNFIYLSKDIPRKSEHLSPILHAKF